MITNKTTDLKDLNFQEGEVILIDKPAGWASFKVIREIRKVTGVKKVGHAGTLDPMATGLLIVATGKKTKTLDEYQALKKTYTGTITLGKTSPSMDLETVRHSGSEKPFDHISEEEIYNVRDEFLGKIKQVPPMYSAIKHKGKSLYHFARQGKIVEREPREIIIYDFKINKIELPDIFFKITCSKGTYIRVIANDFGEKLGCGGLLSTLRRTKIGDYSVEDAFSVDEFVKIFSH